ncbi:hypothetical protein [Acetobacter malorum]|uniref:hypothetical protein n=1 Tax=Acetobacter malorum TaxID=178901 RepID=UPI00248DD2AD|nr:hypothetical protein [Acetobacter malorum]
MKRTPLILGCVGMMLVGTLAGCAGPVYGGGYDYNGYSPSYGGYDEYYGYGSGPRWGYADRRARPFPGGSRPGMAPRPGGRPGGGGGMPRPPGPGGGGRPGGGGHGPGGGGKPGGPGR